MLIGVRASPGVAALGTPQPTGQVSYGAALGRIGRCTTPHAQRQSTRRDCTSARLECDAGSPGCSSKTAMCEGSNDGHSQVMQEQKR